MKYNKIKQKTNTSELDKTNKKKKGEKENKAKMLTFW